jgi:hypothetical protein
VSTVPIAISAESRLLASNGRSFRFIKSEGITIAPQMTQVSAQQEVNFSVYYERLNPGIEIFDLFECEDSNGTEYWNSYNIRVSNPATSQNYPQQPNTQTYPNNTPTYPNNTPSYPSIRLRFQHRCKSKYSTKTNLDDGEVDVIPNQLKQIPFW